MTDGIEVQRAREALANLPEGTSHGEAPAVKQVYLPRSHLKAMHPDILLVTGMRGSGKTFWWSALQDGAVRDLVGWHTDRYPLSGKTEVRTGFGVRHEPMEYPGKDTLRHMLNTVEPRIAWRTVQAWKLVRSDHPLGRLASWPKRAEYVEQNPEAIELLFQDRDGELDRRGVYSMVIFDALDRCADDWKEMYRAIRGLLQTALEMRSYRRLRVKVFLRSDQVDPSKVADFPDASKVLSSAVALNWPRRELYGLLWHYLVNGPSGDHFRRMLGSHSWDSVDVRGRPVFSVPRRIVNDEDDQRERFHAIAGRWMGRGPKRGFPYTWIPNHLADTEGRVSPRPFLAALRQAAAGTADEYPDHQYALHYDCIKRGVQEASKIRVSELREDYPWVDRVLTPLAGMVVPCAFEEITKRWRDGDVLDRLTEDVAQDEVKLPPRHIEQGSDGVRLDLESLRVFLRLRDGRVNIPDVFRVGYGLGRKGGVKPIR